MNPQRIAVKLFTTQPVAREELHPFIGVFHRFIQESALPGLLIDVADYAHVPEGPGVILIGHDVDYGIDLGGGRAGLLTTRKRAGALDLPSLLRDVLLKASAAARAIEADPVVALRFASDAMQIAIPDRLALPNTAGAFELVTKELEPVATEVYGAAARFTHESASDPRRMLTLSLSGDAASAEAWLARTELH
jgi:hypothetical protein